MMRPVFAIPSIAPLATVALIVGLGVAACGGGDAAPSSPSAPEPSAPAPAGVPEPTSPPAEPEPPAASEPAEPTPVEPVPAPAPDPAPSPEPTPPVEPVPEPPSDPPVDPGPIIEVVGGKPVEGVTKIRVRNGETARFSVASDVPAEVHVHGLEVTKNVGPDKAVKFRLKTSFEGIFEIELHGPAGDVEIASLVIRPS